MTASTIVRSVRDQITDLIREDLLCGRIPPGARLSEAKLAERFGVSRGPIREALAQLTNEGLLVSKPNCGVSVAPEPTDDVRDLIIPIRRTIETYALKLIFEKLDERDFRIWEEILHRLDRACRDHDVEAIALQDIAFHRAIIVRSEQPDLMAIWQTILVRVRGHFREAVHRYGDAVGKIVDEHRQLVEIFRAGDKAAAIKALEEHIW
jgi:GntR family transcriptional regulator, rspAB operon transcriptional repressor